jgi:hypothetical protein
LNKLTSSPDFVRFTLLLNGWGNSKWEGPLLNWISRQVILCLLNDRVHPVVEWVAMLKIDSFLSKLSMVSGNSATSQPQGKLTHVVKDNPKR